MPILQKRKLRHMKVESAAQAPPTIKAQLSSAPHPSPSAAAKNKSDSGWDVQGPTQEENPDCVIKELLDLPGQKDQGPYYPTGPTALPPTVPPLGQGCAKGFAGRM